MGKRSDILNKSHNYGRKKHTRMLARKRWIRWWRKGDFHWSDYQNAY